MSLVKPSLMFEHSLNALAGWFEPAALDFAAPMAAGVAFAPPPGRAVHLNAAREFEMGCSNTGMTIFLHRGAGMFDVSNPGRTALGNFVHEPVSSVGIYAGLVAKGGYELETSEFDQTRDYAVGDLLTAVADNADEELGGILTNEDAVQFINPVCGVVSRGAYKNEHSITVLAFWPEWLPGAA